MAYTFKGNTIMAPITIKSNQPQTISDTANLKRLVSDQDAQRWELSFGLAPTTSSGALMAAVTLGALSASTMTMPQLHKADRSGECQSEAVVDSVSASGDDEVDVALDAADIGNTIFAGTFIKFDNHDKVYMVTEDVVTTDNTTEALATLPIYPSLRTALAGSEVMYYLDDVVLSYWLDDTLNGVTYQDGIISGVGSVTVIEAI